MNPLKAFVGTLKTSDNAVETIPTSVYDIAIHSLHGIPLDLAEYKGKYILFVNVASKCGFTSQYRELQQLQDTYADKLVVIGVPCNQFGGQEPGTSEDIQSFCEVNYGVTFPMTEKINVKGNDQHPLYAWLTKKAYNGKKNSSVKWNFQKYLLNTNGELIDYFYSITKPTNSRITAYLK